jgi:hypothetical protein
MAVSIDEMHVEVKDADSPAPAARPAAAGAEPVDLRAELAIIRERDLRLRAD